MHQPTPTIDPATVKRALAATGWRLRFAPDLEARYDAELSAGRCRKVVWQNYAALAVFDAALLIDWVLVRDVFALAVALRLLVMTPAVVLLNGVLRRRPSAQVREGLLAATILAAVVMVLSLMLASRCPERSSEHVGVLLIVIFATVVQRIGFRFVAIACIGALILDAAALTPLADYTLRRMLTVDIVNAGVVILALVGCYNLEKEQRRSYLLNLRDRLHAERLDALSRCDALTGAGNRRALDLATEAWVPAGHYEYPASPAILLFDVDHFKAYNDNQGHLAGDACLQRVASLIADDPQIGPGRIFRFGGEEFLVMLDRATLAEAAALGERVRARVEAAALLHPAAPAKVVTLSVGAATASPGTAPTIAGIIADADRALYEAKRNGRNQVRPRLSQAADEAAPAPRAMRRERAA